MNEKVKNHLKEKKGKKMEVNPTNMLKKWKDYVESCRNLPSEAKKSGLWKKPDPKTKSNLYLIVPDPSISNKGKCIKGPINLSQLREEIKKVHEQCNAENYQGCIDTIEKSIMDIQDSSKNVIVVTTAAIKPQNSHKMIIGVATLIKSLF